MKTIYTFLLILGLALSISAQKATVPVQKNSTSFSGITAENQTFSISKIYPNPVKDFVTVELQSLQSNTIQLSLFNILGNEVKKWDSFTIDTDDQKFKIDLSSLKTGIYFLKISNAGKVVTQVLKKS